MAKHTDAAQRKIVLGEERIPKSWYNIAAR